MQMFDMAILLDPKFALAYAGMSYACAMVYFWHERNSRWLEKGLAACEQALKLDPQRPEVLVARGLLYYAEKKYAEAIECARIAIERDPACPGAYNVLARAFFESGRFQDAAAIAERAVRANGDDYNLYIPLYNAMENLGQRKEYKEMLELHGRVLQQQLDMVPEDVRARILLASVCAQLGDAERSMKELDKAVALRPNDSTILYNAACAYACLGRKPEALATLQQAVAHGYHNLDWMSRDADLVCLHEDPEFQLLVKGGARKN